MTIWLKKWATVTMVSGPRAARRMKKKIGGATLSSARLFLCGLLVQVGAIYRAQEPDRDSSLEVYIGPRE